MSQNNKKYFKYNQFPLKLVINYIPGEYISDSDGAVYKVNSLLKLNKVIDSPLTKGETLTMLNEKLYNKLYIPITKNEINRRSII